MAIHDESTYHANDDVNECWVDKDELEMRAKSKGKGIMVSDLVFENFGFFCS